MYKLCARTTVTTSLERQHSQDHDQEQKGTYVPVKPCLNPAFMSLSPNNLVNALIRTHHITSRKKIAKLTHAADIHNVLVLLHSGKCPGIMYCEGSEKGVKSWVSLVQSLRCMIPPFSLFMISWKLTGNR
jgi:hypothetical protein